MVRVASCCSGRGSGSGSKLVNDCDIPALGLTALVFEFVEFAQCVECVECVESVESVECVDSINIADISILSNVLN